MSRDKYWYERAPRKWFCPHCTRFQYVLYAFMTGILRCKECDHKIAERRVE